jgi:hypothetical protein
MAFVGRPFAVPINAGVDAATLKVNADPSARPGGRSHGRFARSGGLGPIVEAPYLEVIVRFLGHNQSIGFHRPAA